jgi:hypothetical protein
MDTKQKIIELLWQNGIGDSDRKEWEFLLENSPAELADNMLEIFSAHPEEISWFNDAYKRKKGAFAMMESDKERAQEALQQIFQEEKAKLEELAAKEK